VHVANCGTGAVHLVVTLLPSYYRIRSIATKN
jgi:hypothetical protein